MAKDIGLLTTGFAKSDVRSPKSFRNTVRKRATGASAKVVPPPPANCANAPARGVLARFRAVLLRVAFMVWLSLWLGDACLIEDCVQQSLAKCLGSMMRHNCLATGNWIVPAIVGAFAEFTNESVRPKICFDFFGRQWFHACASSLR